MSDTVPVPTNAEEAEQLEKKLSEYKLTRIAAARDFLAGPETTAFIDGIAAIVDEGLPAGSSAQGNLAQLKGWLDRAKAGVDSDYNILNAIVNPPAPPAPITDPSAPPLLPAGDA